MKGFVKIGIGLVKFQGHYGFRKYSQRSLTECTIKSTQVIVKPCIVIIKG